MNGESYLQTVLDRFGDRLPDYVARYLCAEHGVNLIDYFDSLPDEGRMAQGIDTESLLAWLGY